MRVRPFIQANESPRPFSEILDERRRMDPQARLIASMLDEIGGLEAQAAEQTDPKERDRILCQAEALRAAIHEQNARK